MQKTHLYKRCLRAVSFVLALSLPLVSLAENFRVVTGGRLNLRETPSLSSKVLGQYPTGTWMTVESTEGDWSKVIVDPSAASFLEVLRRRGLPEKKAKNDVLSGIRLTADLLKSGKVVICAGCGDCLREMDEYVWDLSCGSGDQVKKEHDHAMDDMRYFVSTVLGEKSAGFVACSVERRK